MKRAVLLFLLPALLAARAGGAAEPAARPALPADVAACEGCHGQHGEGNRAQNAPRIAGQSADYLARQLAAFADGRRESAIMTPIAKPLDEKLRGDLARYFAALAPPALPAAHGFPEAGRRLATTGDNARRIQACDNCHGPDGIGEPPGYPYLGGQHRSYLIAMLAAWRNGSRKTDPSEQMPTIARRLSDEEISAVADYYATKRPPSPDAFRIVRRAPAAPKPGQAAPPGRPGGEAQPTGVEQGAPTTGGAQGPGGGGGTREERAR